jgi:tetratricopeptide (TPR) repeat protein
MPGRARSGARARWPGEALVGRDELLGALTGVAAAAASGTGSVVLLTGEAGIGKTSVARALAAEVRDDLAVSWGSCVVDGSAPPFWPWRELVDPPPARAVSRREVHAQQAVGAQRFEQLNQLRDQIVERAHGAPLLHVIEDLQWADVASVLLLAHLGGTLVDAPLLVVGTLRTGEPLGRQLDEAMESVRRSARAHELLPLDDVDIARLIRDTGIEPDDDLLALVRARTGGNALFVTELLRSPRAADLAERVPSRVSELLAHRLARLPAAVADMLVAAAVVGAEGEARTLAAATGSSLDATLDLLDQARASHLLDTAPPGRWQFRHQLVRDAVYAGAADATRARHHVAVLETLAADDSTPAPVIAHHALAAQPLFDADRAVALAARAGEVAFAQHAYEEAIAWFERALAAAPADTSPRWRSELLVLCGEAHRDIGEIDSARRAFLDAATRTDDPALLARAALGYADPGADLGIAFRSDDPVTATLLDRARAAQPEGDSVTTVLLEARLAAELYFSDDPGRARALADTAVARATRLDDPRALGAATAVAHDAFTVGQAPMAEQLRQSSQLLTWARAAGSAAGLLTAHRARTFDLLAAGHMAGMDAEILAFRRLAEPLRAPGYLWWPALWSAMRALLEGRHDVAEQRALDAYTIGEGPFPSLAFINLSFLLFFLRREQGRFAEMEQATRDYAASHADIPALRVALTFLLAELGRTDEAGGMLADVDADALDRLHDRNWPASWFQLARAVAIVGDRALAATLLTPRHRPDQPCVTVSLGTVCLGSSDLATAWLHHTAGDLDAADRHYDVATTVNARIGARSWLAQVRADHARLLLDRGAPGDVDAATRLTALAAEAADDIGLGSVAGTLDDLRHRLRAPAPASAGLATFRQAGAVWELDFADHAARIPHARGLRDVAHLLARPGQAVSVLELVEPEAATSSGVRGAPALDERARREIATRLRELDAEEADADASGDGERAALVRERRQELAEAVARDVGLGGRSRRIGDPVERARKTVSTRIRRAIVLVGRAHPELGRHLERSIDTGAWCAYRPAEPVTWTT